MLRNIIRKSHSAGYLASIKGIETRWVKLPEAEQGAIADRIALAEKGDWKNMTLEEKRAAYYIAYGAYGARNPRDKALPLSIGLWSVSFIGLGMVMWSYYMSLKPVLRTTTKEWKEEEDRIALEEKANPYSGVYAGKWEQEVLKKTSD